MGAWLTYLDILWVDGHWMATHTVCVGRPQNLCHRKTALETLIFVAHSASTRLTKHRIGSAFQNKTQSSTHASWNAPKVSKTYLREENATLTAIGYAFISNHTLVHTSVWFETRSRGLPRRHHWWDITPTSRFNQLRLSWLCICPRCLVRQSRIFQLRVSQLRVFECVLLSVSTVLSLGFGT